MKLLIVDWNNSFIGMFNESTLEQISNTYKDLFVDELHRVIKMYNQKSVEIEYVDYEYIVRERKKRGYEAKCIF